MSVVRSSTSERGRRGACGQASAHHRGVVDELGGVDVLVDGVMDAIARDATQVYLPEWFKEIAATKAGDVEAFLAGSAAWVRDQQDA
jgi:hypothetical protein